MDANVVFRAYARARDEMEIDLANRADKAFWLPVSSRDAYFGIGIDTDKYARHWQKHMRQMKAFEERMRHIVNEIDGITYPENVGKSRIKLPREA